MVQPVCTRYREGKWNLLVAVVVQPWVKGAVDHLTGRESKQRYTSWMAEHGISI